MDSSDGDTPKVTIVPPRIKKLSKIDRCGVNIGGLVGGLDTPQYPLQPYRKPILPCELSLLKVFWEDPALS